jgi:hypothetical protein
VKIFWLFIGMYLMSAISHADSYLCIAEAGAGVSGDTSGIESKLYDVRNEKYIVSNESGSWEFKELGEDSSLLVCETEYYCRVPGGFAAIFFKDKESGIFTYVSSVMLPNQLQTSVINTVRGRCSKL